MWMERCQIQTGTLDECYTLEGIEHELGETMRALFRRLREHPVEHRAYGLTSHHHLCLLTEDTGESTWWVRFIGINAGWYSVSYVLPESYRPWQRLSGEAQSESQAVEMILQAMEWCGGWGPVRECNWKYPVADGKPMELVPCSGFDLQTYLNGMVQAHLEVENLLGLVRQLAEVPFPRPVYITGQEYGGLRLVAEDNPAGSPYIDIHSQSLNARLPESWAPWPGATVEADFSNRKMALELVMSGLRSWLVP